MVNKESPLAVSDSLDGSPVSVVQYKPTPLTYRGPAESYVDKVLITSNEYDNFLVKVLSCHLSFNNISSRWFVCRENRCSCDNVVGQK